MSFVRHDRSAPAAPRRAARTRFSRRAALKAAGGLALIAPMYLADANAVGSASAQSTTRVSAIGARQDALGATWVYGIVENGGTAPLQDVEVTVTLVDSGGARVAETKTTALHRLIPPGGRAPFAALFVEPVRNWRRAGAATASRQVEPAVVAGNVSDLKLTNVKVAEGSFGRQIIGELANSIDAPLTGVQLTAAVFQADGAIQYLALGFLAIDPLPAGAVFPFSVDLPGLDRDARLDRFEMFAEGWRLA